MPALTQANGGGSPACAPGTGTGGGGLGAGGDIFVMQGATLTIKNTESPR